MIIEKFIIGVKKVVASQRYKLSGILSLIFVNVKIIKVIN